jgi:hypothetical protein
MAEKGPSQPKQEDVSPGRPVVTSGADRIHTFKTDAEKTIESEGLSPLSILAKESDSGRPAPKPKARVPLVPILIGGALFVGGVGIIGAVFFLMQPPPPVAVEARVETPITVNDQVKVSGDTFIGSIIQQLSAGTKEGNITHLLGIISHEDGMEEIVPISRVFESLGAPDILVRSLDVGGMVSLFGEEGKNEVVIVTPISSFERTFRGMLAWESQLAFQGDAVFGTLDTTFPPVFVEDLIATGTPSIGTETPAMATTTPDTRIFVPIYKDVVIVNVDTRILYDAKGLVHILYGFPRENMLIIATSEAAFREAVSRLLRE